jgi:hypothetical protein
LSETVFSTVNVLCMKLDWHANGWKEPALNSIHLPGKPTYLPFVDRDACQDEVVVLLPTARLARFVQVKEVHGSFGPEIRKAIG